MRELEVGGARASLRLGRSAESAQVMPRIGFVVIGRNEGERLMRCLDSTRGGLARIVYVDSASSDGSAERVEARSITVVRLDATCPFTAARARNAGFAHLREIDPGVEFVQFLDGDCELREGWVDAAADHLAMNPDVAVVCGRRRESHPEASIYNRLADREWDTPIGEALACGGDAMIRALVLEDVGGYDERLIAGEEPELCLRIRSRGHRVVRLDREMTLHDAAMTQLGQWWRRQARAGHAYAEAAWMHGHGPERFRVREVLSIFAWGLGLPVTALLFAPVTAGTSLAFALVAYIGLWLRIRHRHPGPDGSVWATSCVAGKWAQAAGLMTFAWNRLLRGRSTALIEYKGAADATALHRRVRRAWASSRRTKGRSSKR